MPRMLRGLSALFMGALTFHANGQQQCAQCHPKEVTAFAQSRMGNSLTDPAKQPDGTVLHVLSGSKVSISHAGGRMEHRLEHNGLSATYPIAYGVGAGQVGYSYMVRIGNYLFQSPVSYYTQHRDWDLTPGYEGEKNLDFTHPILSGCLFCHTGSVHLLDGANNKYADPAFTPISCERCHGSSAKHLQRPVPGSIVNPAKLPMRARDSVCEQCHLEGDERVLNPGRDWWDFKAGDELETTFAIYLARGTNTTRAVSQAEHLAESRCARESGGKLWCGTCHNPHDEPADRATQMRTICLSCHEQLFTASHHKPASECTSCHMPRLRAENVAHAEITDHRIVRYPGHRSEPSGEPQLVAWHGPDPGLRDRDLGLAYFQIGATRHDASAVRRSYEILAALPPSRRDPEVLADLASVLLQAGRASLAVKLFRDASTKEPRNDRFAYALGVALEDSGDLQRAIAELRRSIELDSSQPGPYLRLAEIYAKQKQETLRRGVLDEYLNFMPQNFQLRSMASTP